METSIKPDSADARLEEALTNFRASVQAWSEAAFSQPRTATAPERHSLAWRRLSAWSMGVLLATGVASGALYQHHHQQVLAVQARQHELEHQRLLAAQRSAEMDQLLANVDRDVSQEVPDALEPLAPMVSEDGSSK